LDAHQGNGHERDKLTIDDQELYILDVYNYQIYPGDRYAKTAINLQVELRSGTETREYLQELEKALHKAFQEFQPDFIFYNAGTDILENDPLGDLMVSADGIIQRDEMVFREAMQKKIPVVMLLSGGYQQSNARVIADSIVNLNQKFELLTPRSSL